MLTMLFVLLELFLFATAVGIIGWWLEHEPTECTGTHCLLSHQDADA